ncbi:G-type lectin S-receptor-like serine/threonine-protein kinase [Dorcoceras hygrometricum]|uniref:G-type lectin S-receptor-like serine/threonine-protein kinase n=1 Tax=Dorcoceras hygrometricum TaxID=472368 RepID=A0A2Z7CHQ3_9LAMI|nr:G-type lectin S-receptor-like serine/threonine-protein kinase [Dorcoceras hygrometricum]
MTSAESVDGSALMTSAVMSSQQAGSVDGFCDGNNQQTQATVIQSQALQDQRLVYQLQAYLHQPVNQSLAHLDHQLMYQSQATVIQTQATGNQKYREEIEKMNSAVAQRQKNSAVAIKISAEDQQKLTVVEERKKLITDVDPVQAKQLTDYIMKIY